MSEAHRNILLKIPYNQPSIAREQIVPTLDAIFDPLPKSLSERAATSMLLEVLNDFDPGTAQHSAELCEIARIVGPSVFFYHQPVSPNLEVDIAALSYAALLHDVGKIGILSILDKPIRNRTSLEFRMLHAEFTRYILQKFPSLNRVEPIASAVHIRSKGLSYPADINWDMIPFEAHILAVIDALHSITHERPGDPARTRSYAIGILQKDGYKPEVVAIIIEMLIKGKIPEDFIPNILI